MAAAVFAGDGGSARAACSAECACGAERQLDLGGTARPAGAGCGKRSVYLMECVPLWGCAATRGRGAEMEDARAAVPRFADVPAWMLASRHELDAHGLDFDATALRLPAHLFGVYDGHGGSEVANYCRDRIHVVLREVLRAGRGLGDLGEVDVKEHWEKVFGDCFQRVDDENISQHKREDDLPDGVLSVSLLKHQKMALAWMVSKENSSHCAGGILANDQGLGKTVSTIALIQKQRIQQSKFMYVDSDRLKSEALNLDEDDEAVIVVDKGEQTLNDEPKKDLEGPPTPGTPQWSCSMVELVEQS